MKIIFMAVILDPIKGKVTLTVSPSDYAILSTGQTYTKTYRIGLLGIQFKKLPGK